MATTQVATQAAPASSLMWVWVLLAVAGLGALGYFVIIPWLKKDDKPKKDSTATEPTTTGGNGGNGGNGGSGNNASNESVLAVFKLHKFTKVVNLKKGSTQAKLAQYCINEGLKAYGLDGSVSIDGAIGPKSKAALAKLVRPPFVATPETITLEGIAQLVQSKINGSEPLEKGISRITLDKLQ